MEWTKDIKTLSEIYEDCCRVGGIKPHFSKNDFVRRLTDENEELRARLGRAVHVFDTGIGNYGSEHFLKLCFERNYLDRKLFSGLYLTVHTNARPYRYLTKQMITDMLKTIETPLLCDEAKTKYPELPSEFRVYRGMRERPVDLDGCGYCWSLDERITHNFATGDDKIHGFLITGQVIKVDIFGYILCRRENEIVIDPRKVSKKTIAEVKPL
ncbi:hypothetical protein [Parachryseolinea silvisoli]|uniref:hypothetical protein n=1 Tax=Parachryseolinea silvisoli TaxID=2873601 RepID=UPI00226598AF|nr:hypothetical protein [Parachryseolinea silvisoli]MCD9015204.1 hypothetical protein [Parachryseolinea silvisoli]